MTGEQFTERSEGELLVVSSPELARLPHGFTGSAIPQKGDPALPQAEIEVARSLGLERVIFPIQIHGDRIWDLRSKTGWESALAGEGREADAVIALRERAGAAPGRYAIGVKSADCLPVLFAGESIVAAVHAGWRGLANGILRAVSEEFLRCGEHRSIVLIGPAAGADYYEVGGEVLVAIGDSARSRPSSNLGKHLLDLEATAAAQLSRCLPEARVSPSGYSTMGDPRFASHRLEAQRSRRNIAYIAASPGR